MAIRIITDSSCDISLEEAQAKNIQLVYMQVHMDGKSYHAGLDLTPSQFYPLLEAAKAFPTTSQPAPDEFLHAFEEAKAAGDQVVCITLSSGLSGTTQSAMIAKDLSEYSEIYIVDSLTATAATRILVDVACSMREKGATALEIQQKLEQLVPRVHAMGVVNTLEYLFKGGRLSALQAGIGTAAKLKPIVGTRGGQVVVLGKAFGFAAGVKHMLKLMGAQPLDPDYPSYCLYTSDPDKVGPMLEKFREAGVSTDRMRSCCIGPTIGSHIGPGVIGIAYVERERTN